MHRKALVFHISILATLDMFDILCYNKLQFMTICFTYEHQKTGLGMFCTINFFDFNIMANNESYGFETFNDFRFSSTIHQHC